MLHRSEVRRFSRREKATVVDGGNQASEIFTSFEGAQTLELCHS